MHDRLAAWHAEHVNFAKLLALLHHEVQVFHAGGSPQYGLMLDIVYYMTHYADVLHHPGEELVFAMLKCRDVTLAADVDRLMREHVRLKLLGEHLARDLDDVVNGSIAPRQLLEAAAQEYIDCLRAHMDLEEGGIMPRAERLLNADDWARIEQVLHHVEDPLFGSFAEKRYAALRAQIAREASAAGQPL